MTNDAIQTLEKEIARFHAACAALRSEIGKVTVGQKAVVEQVLWALFAGGHVLLEGVPGLGKTLLAKTLGEALSLRFTRIQFTPDLMPADVVGTEVLMEDERGRHFEFRRGPVFTQILLADEINRATPKTQSALLEAMQEHTVTVAGDRHALQEPFWVLATQNPIEMEGTYSLPEAQLDRFFFKVTVPFPDHEDLMKIIERTTGAEAEKVEAVVNQEEILAFRALVRQVPVAKPVMQAAVRLVEATHPGSPQAPEDVKRYVRLGSSPRGAQAIVLAAKVRALGAGRYNVSREDLDVVALPALRHRILLAFEAEVRGVSPDTLIHGVLEKVP